MNANLLWIVCIAYLLGSIPSSYWIGRLFYGIHLDREGSLNLGATNALRVMGKTAGAAALALDVAKGVIAIEVARQQGVPGLELAAGLIAIAGHSFSVFVRFKGGKGVATSAGVFLALSPMALGKAMALFILTVALSRYVSLGSILAALSLPLFIYEAHPESSQLLAFSLFMALFVVFRHRSNLRRLWRGEEHRLGQRQRSQSDA